MKAPNMDAMFIDNCFATPFYAGYYDLTNNYPKLDYGSAAAEWMLRGDQHFFNRYQQVLAAAYPGRTYLSICNMADWAQVWASASGGANFTAATQGLIGQIHGGVLERMIDPGNTPDTPQGEFGATATLGAYQAIMNFCIAPKQVVFNGYVASKVDFQGARYILTAALMDDGYCCVSNDSSETTVYTVDQYVWYDEYGGNPNTGIAKGWLGFRVGSAPTGPAVNGLWIAEFDNGVAICNPGNASQTITAAQINTYLGGSHSFSYINGVQDPTTNPGGSFSQATLAVYDGLLLRKNGSSTVTLQGSWDSGYISGPVSTKSVARNSNVNVGDILVVCVLGNVNNNVQSVNDGQFGALTFDPGAEGFDTQDSSWMQLFWATATQNYSADPGNSVVATFKSSTDFAEVIVAHFRPPTGYVFAPTASVLGAAVFDDTQVAPGMLPGAIKSGATNFSSTPMLAFAGSLDVTGNGGQTADNGWTSGFTGNAGNFVPAWTLVTSTGGKLATWTAAGPSGGLDTYQGVLVGFKMIAG